MLSFRTKFKLSMEISEQTLKIITGAINAGYLVFFDKETGKHHEINTMDFEEKETDFEDPYRAYRDASRYIQISKPNSKMTLGWINDFVQTIESGELKRKLDYALSRKNPHAAFKKELDFDSELRQNWFEYKAEKGLERVKSILNIR